jgi:dihydropyrimidinase
MAADGYEFADRHGAVLVGGAGRYSADWLIHGWQRARSFLEASGHLLRPVLGLCLGVHHPAAARLPLWLGRMGSGLSALSERFAEARGLGLPVYGETLHHYAIFTADAYLRPDGVIFHTYPSLKSEEDRQRLWTGLRTGTLSTVATDELYTPRAIKVRSRHVADATGGHVGVETRVPIIYTEGVSKRGMSLERFVAVTSSNAAKILGLYPKKGAIAVGGDADLVVFDATVHWTLRSEDLHGSDYSAWEGWEVHGWPQHVLPRGKIEVENGKLLGRASDGRRVPGKLAAAIQDGPTV